jgi:uncharacterized membrane protein
MKKNIFALFSDIDVADKAINEIHQSAGIEKEEISYVYRNKDGDKVDGTADDIANETTAEGAADGAKVGGMIGAGIGLAAVIGVAGPLAVIATGPIAVGLGLTGAVGTVAAGGVAGAAAGGIIGALMNLGLTDEKARAFEERVEAGDVLVAVHAEDDEPIIKILTDHQAQEIEIISENI